MNTPVRCTHCGAYLGEPGVELTPTTRKLFEILMEKGRINSVSELNTLMLDGKARHRFAARSQLFHLRNLLKGTPWNVRTSLPYLIYRRNRPLPL